MIEAPCTYRGLSVVELAAPLPYQPKELQAYGPALDWLTTTLKKLPAFYDLVYPNPESVPQHVKRSFPMFGIDESDFDLLNTGARTPSGTLTRSNSENGTTSYRGYEVSYLSVNFLLRFANGYLHEATVPDQTWVSTDTYNLDITRGIRSN